MWISTVISFIGGLSLFLFGMTVTGDSLRVLAGGRPQALIGKLCKTPVRGVILGTAVTALVQSSSATTVMVIGFVNSGIMTLRQSIGVIMGANLGTTVTSWLLALTGVGEGFFRFFDPSFFSPLLALAGIVLIMRKKGHNRRHLGYAFLGFTVLIFGMKTMSGAVKPLSEMPEFVSLLTAFSRPIPGFLAGALLTALIQSSSASIGILGALSASGAITVGGTIPIILGQNVGTCVTTLISGVGASKNARRAAFVHLYFNLIGAAVQMAIFLAVSAVKPPALLTESASVTSIAVVHTLFNVISLLILFPFIAALERLATLTVPDVPRRKRPIAAEITNTGADRAVRAGFEDCRLLDDRFLGMPSFALTMCRAAVARMSELCREGLHLLSQRLDGGDRAKTDSRLDELKSLTEGYAVGITDYLTRLAGGRIRLGNRETEILTRLLEATGELRRIGDLTADAVNALRGNGEVYADGDDRAELARLAADTEKLLYESFAVFSGESIEPGARPSSPSEKDNAYDSNGNGNGNGKGNTNKGEGPSAWAEAVAENAAALRQRRIARLAAGEESPRTASVLDSVTVALEHILGHTMRISG